MLILKKTMPYTIELTIKSDIVSPDPSGALDYFLKSFVKRGEVLPDYMSVRVTQADE